jgi:hypothetical protein
MLIRIERNWHGPDATFGLVRVDGEPVCVSREDPIRSDHVFIPGESGLPAGLFNLTMAHSRRWCRKLPLVVSTQPRVERRLGAVRCGMFFHPGEGAGLDLGGEIVLGMALDGEAVVQTGLAFEALSSMIRAALERGEAIEVEIN